MVDEPPAILGLLGDPVRWRLIVELGRSDRRVGELVELVGRPQNVVSYHLGQCRRVGVVTARRSSADGRDVYYRADLARCAELLGDAGPSLHPALVAGAPASPPQLPMARRRRPTVLFLCTGNSARSQIAEALLEHRSAGTVTAQSAGSHPKPMHLNAVRVLAERGIDISDRSSKSIDRFRSRRFDRVITLCDKVREVCPEFPGSPIASHWSIADPAASGDMAADTYPAFEQVADEIDGRIALLLAELRINTSGGVPHG